MSKQMSIKAKDGFEHDGLNFSAGVHNVDAELGSAIVKAGKAAEFKRPKEAEGANKTS